VSPFECLELSLGPFEEPVRHRLERWQQEDIGRRIWAKDPTVWFPGPTPEIIDRLGWLGLPEKMPPVLGDLEAFADGIRAAGFRQVVLLGMGGSSLAPEVYQAVFGAREGSPGLIVLDSTHPDTVREVADRIEPEQTLLLVSSKSGTTLETLSLLRFFWAWTAAQVDDPGGHFVAITDPGSPLVRLASERGFRRAFEAPPDIGGRYSALSMFGLVPAALIGMDLPEFLDRARRAARAAAPEVAVPHNPALRIGATLGELALRGVDKLTLLVPPALAAYPLWLEQLVAESLGKNGHGITPIAGEPQRPPSSYSPDRLFVCFELAGEPEEGLGGFVEALIQEGYPVIRNRLEDRKDLAASIFCWELAVAAAGSLLGVHPFDQPDVQLAKTLAHQAMTGGPADGAVPAVRISDRDEATRALREWIDTVRRGDCVTLLAFLDPKASVRHRLQQLRGELGGRLQVATALGFGPRFLHSTGQLHKGGPDSSICLQLVDDSGPELPVPETDYGFARLVRAQADGDCRALLARGRRVLRIELGSDPAAGLEALAALDLF
jgi:transaldolase/glucose-6-phosphate isomerase